MFCRLSCAKWLYKSTLTSYLLDHQDHHKLSEKLIEMKFSSKKMHVKMTSAKRQLVCLRDKEVNTGQIHKTKNHKMIYSSQNIFI